jgi:hypothetical protein
LLHGLADHGIVFDHQDFHDFVSWLAATRSGAGGP